MDFKLVRPVVAFSLMIHEYPSAVDDLLHNIIHYNPGCIIVIHVNRKTLPDWSLPKHWEERDESSCSIEEQEDHHYHHHQCNCPKEVGKILINPKYIPFEWGNTALKHHNSNWNCLISSGLYFDYFSILSSNQFFVKHGFSDYLSGKLYLTGIIRDMIPAYNYMYRLNPICKVIYDLGKKLRVMSNMEGWTWRKDVYELISKIISTYYGNDDHIPPPPYHQEEFFYYLVTTHIAGDPLHPPSIYANLPKQEYDDDDYRKAMGDPCVFTLKRFLRSSPRGVRPISCTVTDEKEKSATTL